MNKKYKPITFVNGKIGPHRNNLGQQLMLLKAMSITQDPKKLKQMIGVKTVAEVFRTLDKIALRKEYHQALIKHGIDFNYIVSGLKNLGDNANDRIKLNAFQTLLKSLGMEKYDVTDEGGSNDWEETLLKSIEEKKEKNVLDADFSPKIVHEEEDIEEYEAFQPEMPGAVKKLKEADDKLGAELYSNNLYE